VRRFLARRLAHGAAVIFIAASLSFLLVHLAPGDPFSTTLDSASISPSVKASWRAAYGLDRPLLEQYFRFLGQLARGNLGPSLMQPVPASAVLAEAVPNTLVLMGTALLLSFGIGIGVGSWQAARAGSHGDRVAGQTSLIFASLPEFWLAAVMLLVFTHRLHLFPAAGVKDLVMYREMSAAGQLLDRLRHLALPALTLALLGSASIARYQRAALLDVLPQDFIRTARATGATERLVLWRHALRNALVPTIVLLGLSLPALLGGAVFVEQVFSWPGLGQTAAAAFRARDYQVVIGATIMGAVLVVAGGILADLLHAAVDPRVRAQ
jgi:peptide/nickel transport system permease protein